MPPLARVQRVAYFFAGVFFFLFFFFALPGVDGVGVEVPLTLGEACSLPASSSASASPSTEAGGGCGCEPGWVGRGGASAGVVRSTLDDFVGVFRGVVGADGDGVSVGTAAGAGVICGGEAGVGGVWASVSGLEGYRVSDDGVRCEIGESTSDGGPDVARATGLFSGVSSGRAATAGAGTGLTLRLAVLGHLNVVHVLPLLVRGHLAREREDVLPVALLERVRLADDLDDLGLELLLGEQEALPRVVADLALGEQGRQRGLLVAHGPDELDVVERAAQERGDEDRLGRWWLEREERDV